MAQVPSAASRHAAARGGRRSRWSALARLARAVVVVAALSGAIPRASDAQPTSSAGADAGLAVPSPGARADAATRAARPVEHAAANREFQREMAELKLHLLHRGARAKLDRSFVNRNRDALARPGSRARTPRDHHETIGPQGSSAVRAPARTARATAGLGNRRVNDPRMDPVSLAAQSEVSLAGQGRFLLAAWNDGYGNSSIGYGWSADSGATWVDGGDLPLGAQMLRWVSDPVVSVDERRREFWVCGMAFARGLTNAIFAMRATFSDEGPVWSEPEAVRIVRDTLPDKPWIAADSTTGHVYVSYTAFFREANRQHDQIEFQRRRADGVWELPRVLSSARDRGLVQGSRPAVGPAGELFVTWMAVDTSEAAGGADYLRLRASGDGGATFEAEETVATAYSNVASGAPGFDRGNGFMFPGIAVDRTAGPHRGRVYVTWQESVNWFDDAPGDSNPRPEREPNDDLDHATTFNVGETVHGGISKNGDVDYLSFIGYRGETVLLYLDSLSADFDVALRVVCSSGEVRLAYSEPGWAGRPRVVVFTPASSADYLVVVSSYRNKTGTYRLRTGRVFEGPERGRDHRDVFTAWRDRGGGWSEPVRIGDDPPWLDDWLPEIAVAPSGDVYAAWYDWRESASDFCGGASNVRLARSNDGGATWAPLGVVTDAATNWSDVGSNLSPNQGDYIGLHAGDYGVGVAWADGRSGDPDVMFAREPDRGAAGPPPRVPAAAALEWLSPNPAPGAFRADFALRGDGPAALELLDVAGRLHRRIDVTAFGPGRHTTALDARGLPPGIYLVRLVEAGRAGARKLVLAP